MATVDDVKTLLMGAGDGQDDLLALIIKNSEAGLRLRIKAKADSDVPTELEYVVTEVAVRRFNRLKNEGMTSYGQEGETISFSASDFDDFSADIDAWLDANAKSPSLGAAGFFNAYGGGH